MDDVNEVTYDNPDEIQICNSLSVVKKKIEYFLKRKREECDDRNKRLYRRHDLISKYFGSSRTHSKIEVKYQKGSECFIKNSKMNNITGPQCNGDFNLPSEKIYTPNNTSSVGIKPDVQERISNLETCLNIKSNGDNNFDVYEKLKSIEDHVLKLENQLLNNDKYHSLANDQYTEITNHNLKTNNSSQENPSIYNIKNEMIEFDENESKEFDALPINTEQLITEDNIKNEVITSEVSNVFHNRIKYTAEDIQKFINIINGVDE